MKRSAPYFIIFAIVLFFFAPVFKGFIPFPGDLLINQNPYKTESFLGYAPSGFPNKAQGPDVINQIYPWRYFSINELKQGSIPFWNPYNFSGNLQMANFQTAIFYPFNFLYFIFQFNTAWTLIIMLQPFLAAVFMYLFLLKALSLKKFASFIGGVIFAFSSYMVVWLEYGNIGNTLLWLPLSLLLTKQFFKKQTASNFLGLTSVLSISILAGYIQGSFYIYLFCFLYFFYLLFKDKNFNLKKIAAFFSALMLPFFITAFQLFPTFKLFLNSTRSSYSLEQVSNLLAPPYYWVTIMFPDFFGNPATRNYWFNGTYIERVMYFSTAALFFGLLGIVKGKSSEKKFFLGISIISLVVATNFTLIKYFYLIPIPIISTTVPTRGLSIFIFSSIVLAAIGIDYWASEVKIKSKLPLFFIAFYLFTATLTVVLFKINLISQANFNVTARNLILPTSLALLTVAVFYLRKKFKKISFILLTIVVIFDLFYFFNKITPFSPASFTYPKTPVISFLKENAGINRFWGYGSAYIASNFQSVDNTYSPEGNDPLHISSYGELLASSKNGQVPKALPRPDANIAPGYGKTDLRENFYRQKILNLLGVKYVLHQSAQISDLETFPKDKYQLVWQDKSWQVYENKQALPRFFMANDYVLATDREKELSLIYDKNVDLSKTLILEEKPKIKIDKNSTGAIKLISYKSNEVRFKVESLGNNLLFLSDNYYPGWHAKIDGKAAFLQKADYTFRAVAVPNGVHEVVFVFIDDEFNKGLVISSVGVIGLLFGLVLLKKYEKKF